MSKNIELNQLKAGDIILFASDDEPKPDGLLGSMWWYLFVQIGRKIRKRTDSVYTHAAICYDEKTLAHAPKPRSRIQKAPIHAVLSSCRYAAVFRSSWAFGGDRVQKLQFFLDRIVQDSATYNTWGVWRFASRKAKHLETLKERLEAHFNGQGTPESFDKKSYFCSELVAACLCVIGAIEPIAAVVFHPRTTSPADLGKDPTWGTFLGYLVPNAGTVIPADDEFYNNELLPVQLGGI